MDDESRIKDKESGSVRVAQPAKKSARPTLKTIAALSGLAVPTVSRALNNASDISAETKRLVQRIANEIGYVPDRAGRRLRTGKTNVISLVLSTEHDVMNYTARMISSIASAFRNTPYHLIVTPYFPNEDPLRPIRYITETRSADGLILNQTLPEDPRVAHLLEVGFPFVTHGRTIWKQQHPYFDFENGEFGRICVRRLAEQGRKHILLVAPPFNQNYSIEMCEGVLGEAAKLGLDVQILPEVTSDHSPEIVMETLSAKLMAEPQIDGIIAPSASCAMSVVSAGDTLGLVIGTDYDLVAKEGLPFLNRFRKEIIVISEDVSSAGGFMARALMHRIDHPDEPVRQYLDIPTD